MGKSHKLAAVTILILIAALPTRTSAEVKYLTIGKLRGYCMEVEKLSTSAADVKTATALYCTGVLIGYVDAFPMGFMFGSDGKQHKLYCPLKGVDTPQRAKVFVNWTERHPERWHEFWLNGVFGSFREAWPCSK